MGEKKTPCSQSLKTAHTNFINFGTRVPSNKFSKLKRIIWTVIEISEQRDFWNYYSRVGPQWLWMNCGAMWAAQKPHLFHTALKGGCLHSPHSSFVLLDHTLLENSRTWAFLQKTHVGPMLAHMGYIEVLTLWTSKSHFAHTGQHTMLALCWYADTYVTCLNCLCASSTSSFSKTTFCHSNTKQLINRNLWMLRIVDEKVYENKQKFLSASLDWWISDSISQTVVIRFNAVCWT